MEMPARISSVGWFGMLIFIVIIDVIQHIVIISANMLKTILYVMMPELFISQLLPYSVYNIHIYHVGVTFVTILIFGVFSEHLRPMTDKLLHSLEQYFTPPAGILTHSFSDRQSNQRPTPSRIQSWLLSLNLAKSTYVGFSLSIIFGTYFFIIAFIGIDQYLYNVLFSIGISTILLCISENQP